MVMCENITFVHKSMSKQKSTHHHETPPSAAASVSSVIPPSTPHIEITVDTSSRVALSSSSRHCTVVNTNRPVAISTGGDWLILNVGLWSMMMMFDRGIHRLHYGLILDLSLSYPTVVVLGPWLLLVNA